MHGVASIRGDSVAVFVSVSGCVGANRAAARARGWFAKCGFAFVRTAAGVSSGDSPADDPGVWA
jgi:hypothetical protein